ncbi:MAG: hypothetical protein CBE26_01205 [Kiritimatiellaceae bacterium TMED266]|nr:MAG: hypothetical protein CBE26_01205 [Kiritimatiellaceae bacterium TMED266]
MITVKKYNELGKADFGWLQANYHFSFANFHHPDWMSHGALRVVNDDIIAPQSGFDTHPHRDMEIITYVREGAITHRDSEGNSETIEAGCVQVMSAGSGIYHSEHNQTTNATNIYQIWIEPKTNGLTPSWKTHRISAEPVTKELKLIVSNSHHSPLQIQQDANVYMGRMALGTTINHTSNDLAYMLISEGTASVNGVAASKGDGLAITNEKSLQIKAHETCEVLLIEVPK